MCQKHWDEQQEAFNKMMSDDFHDVAGANLPPISTRKLKCTDREKYNLLVQVVEAARVSAELSPRVPDGNKFGYDWTIPNPVLEPLAKLDAWEKENGGTEVKSNVKEP